MKSASGQKYGGALWALTGLFFLRVLGQAIQFWAPQPFLPRFDSFQGSNLPYSVLLSAQLVILLAMGRAAHRVRNGSLATNPRVGRWLRWLGGIYLAVAIARLVIGIIFAAAPPWFRAWIPGVFHVVLAAYVVTLGRYHARKR